MKPHKGEKLLQKGPELGNGSGAMILIHGRGSTAEDILSLVEVFDFQNDLTFLAPQAAGKSWYPLSFLAPIEENEPGISSGLLVITEILNEIKAKGIPGKKVFIGGFSQGACLALEFVARNPEIYGGIFGFSGGLIGPIGLKRDYKGSLHQTPVFLGCSDKDPHIPLEKVKEASEEFEKLEGRITEKIYPGMGHTINDDEIKIVRNIIQERLS